MTYFIRRGNTFSPTNEANLDIHTTLPAGNYVVKVVPMSGEMYLESIGEFQFNSKRYGDNIRHTNRIISTFQDRSNSTGIILTGEKGSGKSLLAKTISIESAKIGIPTIVINHAYHGDSFNAFIQGINQPAIILFDEFEKVYNRDEQESVLTLLDGVFPSKKLFIITCNDKWRIDTHMRNRPGRIFYMLEFEGLSTSFIEEYCNDNLINKTHIEKICNIASMFSRFNFDMLKAVVEEMNRYDESPEQVLEWLNSRPEFDDHGSTFDVQLEVNGVTVEPYDGYENWKGNPLMNVIEICYAEPETDDDADSPEPELYRVRPNRESSRFQSTDLVKVDAPAGKFIFINREDDKLILVRHKEKKTRYLDAF